MRVDGLHNQCKTCSKERRKKHYAKNASKELLMRKEYIENNSEKVLAYSRKYQKERRSIDPLFRLSNTLRSRTYLAFKHKGYSKSSKTREMLGAEFELVKSHIEKQFSNGMSWDNYPDWHIDHIIPLASASTEEELIKLCHYTNLQPLWAKDNLDKSDKLNWKK
jgi:hypothetical protein